MKHFGQNFWSKKFSLLSNKVQNISPYLCYHGWWREKNDNT